MARTVRYPSLSISSEGRCFRGETRFVDALRPHFPLGRRTYAAILFDLFIVSDTAKTVVVRCECCVLPSCLILARKSSAVVFLDTDGHTPPPRPAGSSESESNAEGSGVRVSVNGRGHISSIFWGHGTCFLTPRCCPTSVLAVMPALLPYRGDNAAPESPEIHRVDGTEAT